MRALGFRALEVPAEDGALLRRACRSSAAVLEHCDTFRGRADLRPLVRHAIEAFGGKLVGTPAVPAHLADDKILAAERLEQAALKVPRRRVVTRAVRTTPLGFPVVLKRPFDHGSRGLGVARDPESLRRISERLLAAGHGPLLVEEFIEGRELAAAALEVRGHFVCLPIVEVVLRRGRIYGKGLKWGPRDLPIRQAELGAEEEGRIREQVLRACRALGLRDYARFDLRLSAAGDAYFLEANVRPSVEDGTELRLAAELAGLDAEALLALILWSAAGRHGLDSLRRRLEPLVRAAESRLLERSPLKRTRRSGRQGSGESLDTRGQR